MLALEVGPGCRFTTGGYQAFHKTGGNRLRLQENRVRSGNLGNVCSSTYQQPSDYGDQISAMTDLLPIWIKNLTPVEQRLVAGLLVIAILLMLLHLIRKPLADWRERRQITGTVKRLGARMLRDIALPDGMGGEIRIDYLALCSDAILVICVKRYDGMIFGSTKTDEWTQTINSRSYKFPNPDIYLAQQVSALRNITPKIPVRGMHLFTDSAVFPWDKPPNVQQLKDLRSSGRHRPVMQEIPLELRTAWENIMQAINR
jgi:hypothetical protein